MWTDNLESEEDYKRASRLYSPKGINYQTAYQDQASKNNRGLILLKTKEKILLFVKKKVKSLSMPFIFDNKIDELTGEPVFYRDELSNNFLIFLGPKLNIPIIRNFLDQYISERNKIYHLLATTPTDQKKVKTFHLNGLKEFIYEIVRNVNAKIHAEYKEQPVTVLGWANKEDHFFIIKPSNKITEGPLIYEGDLNVDELFSFFNKAIANNLIKTNIKLEPLKETEEILSLPADFSFENLEIDQLSKIYPEYDLYFYDKKDNHKDLQKVN